jgi:glucosamine--fructose-6-phosphate aminotransferase (isomerizing)
MAGEGESFVDDLLAVIDQLDAAIPELEQRIPAVALPFSFVGRMFVIGRGVELATAREIALKLLETCRIAAEPLTATDLAHGPVAALDPFFPVWAIASPDETLPAVVEAAARVSETGATLVASGAAADRIAGPDYVLPVPAPPRPLLAPLLSVIPGQLFAWALARAKRLDPDRPSGLSKVTFAR